MQSVVPLHHCIRRSAWIVTLPSRRCAGAPPWRGPGATEPQSGGRRGASRWLGAGAPPTPAFERWQALERSVGALLGPWRGSLAPATPLGAYMDWWLHLVASPAKQAELGQLAAEQLWHAASIAADGSVPDA